MCPPFGVAFHLSGPSRSTVGRCRLIRSATFWADVRVRTAWQQLSRVDWEEVAMAVAGIDAHKDGLAVAVVDEQGRQLDRIEVENATHGHHCLVGWLSRLEARRVGIEGSGSLGRVAALCLQQAGPTSWFRGGGGPAAAHCPGAPASAQPREVRPTRRLAGGAHRVERRPASVDPSRWRVEDLRVLIRWRRELLAERMCIASRLHGDLEQLHPGYQRRIGRLTTEHNLDRARRLLSGDSRVRARVARQRVSRTRQINREMAAATQEIYRLAAPFIGGLTTIPGIAERLPPS